MSDAEIEAAVRAELPWLLERGQAGERAAVEDTVSGRLRRAVKAMRQPYEQVCHATGSAGAHTSTRGNDLMTQTPEWKREILQVRRESPAVWLDWEETKHALRQLTDDVNKGIAQIERGETVPFDLDAMNVKP